MTDALEPDRQLHRLAEELAVQYRQSGNTEAEEGAIRLAHAVRNFIQSVEAAE